MVRHDGVIIGDRRKEPGAARRVTAFHGGNASSESRSGPGRGDFRAGCDGCAHGLLLGPRSGEGPEADQNRHHGVQGTAHPAFASSTRLGH